MKKGENITSTPKAKLSKLFTSANLLHISPDYQFTWRSGIRTPVYLDLRGICGNVGLRREVLEVTCLCIPPNIDAIGGVATGGIPLSAMLAERLSLPYFYVRPQQKEHGLKKTVEGAPICGADVLLFEELISTGSSLLSALNNLKSSAPRTIHVLSLFSYGLPGVHDRILKAGASTITILLTFLELLDYLHTEGLLPQSILQELARWHKTISQQAGAQV